MPAPALRPAAPATITLGAGQQYHLWSARDAAVVVQSGAIQLSEAPDWIAETMFGVQIDLQEGQHHLLQRSGWTCIEASLDATLLIYASPVTGKISFDALYQFAATAMQRLLRRTLRLLASS